MKRIDTTTLKPYYIEDNDAQMAKVGHVNAVIRAVNDTFIGDLIDPTYNSGISVYTRFQKDELVSGYSAGTTDSYEGYKISVVADLNSGSNYYDLYVGTLKAAAATKVSLSGVKGNVAYTAPFFFPVQAVSDFSYGANVRDVSSPSLLQLDEAIGYMVPNPFDPTEYDFGIYLSAPGSFDCTIAVDLKFVVTMDATIQYSIN